MAEEPKLAVSEVVEIINECFANFRNQKVSEQAQIIVTPGSSTIKVTFIENSAVRSFDAFLGCNDTREIIENYMMRILPARVK